MKKNIKALSLTGLTLSLLGLLNKSCLAGSISSAVNGGGDISTVSNKFDSAVQGILRFWVPSLGVLALVIAALYLGFGHQHGKAKVTNAIVGVGIAFGAILLVTTLAGIFK